MNRRWLQKGLLALILLGIPFTLLRVHSQDAGPSPKPDGEAAEEKVVEGQLPESWAKVMPWRCIGPGNMGGRITALAVNPSDPCMWWAATASGGLLKTTNNGGTFEHQFDQQSTVSIGDVAVAPSNPEIVWVGTGESNPRNSVSWGDGVYKSVDGGATWEHKGLKQSFQIGRIAIHPTDPNTVYVGALGRLWGPSSERGLYKTTDGGETWARVLFVDDRTGVVEVQMHPTDPDTLLVATYERMRDGYDTNDPAVRFGDGSGLHRTTDGGKSWQRVTAGLPTARLGRIGIDYFRKNPEVVFMVLESERIGKEPKNAPYFGITGENADVGARITRVVPDGPADRAGLREGDIVIAMGDVTVHSYRDLLAQARRHEAGDKVEVEVSRARKGMSIEVLFAKRPEPKEGDRRRSPFQGSLGGQRENLQDQQGGDGHEYGGVYRSSDGGASWTRINSVNPRPMYFSQVRVDPQDESYLYVLGVSLYRSSDGGKTFRGDGGRGVHVDHHALWIDPRDGRHQILGNDGGIYVTWDRMDRWDHLNEVAIGQFYHVGVSHDRNYRVYGGLQDNGSWGGPSRVRHSAGPTNSDWQSIGGGDGFVCLVDRHDPQRIYYESQNGGIGRRHLGTGEFARLRPRPPRGTRYRFNWRTPFLLSHHNTQIYYTAGNHVFRSLDRGEGLKVISPEITAGKRGSATALAESPENPDVLYVGTDDGALWVTRDGGNEWKRLVTLALPPSPAKGDKTGIFFSLASPGDASEQGSLDDMLPGARWVSSIVASRYEEGRAYVTFDGHRCDDDEPYVFMTDDHGESWRSLRGNLPPYTGSLKVIEEDLRNQDLLYLGTEFGAWVSIDRGDSWTRLAGDLPTVAVHAFAQPPLVDEVVVGTHGRSVWVLDVAPLRQIESDDAQASAKLYVPAPAVVWRRDPRRGAARGFRGQNPASGAVIYYALGHKAGRPKLRILTPDGELIRELDAPDGEGLQRATWNLRKNIPDDGAQGRRFRRGARVEPGVYVVQLEVGGERLEQSLLVETDPDHGSGAWLEEWLEEEDSLYGGEGVSDGEEGEGEELDVQGQEI